MTDTSRTIPARRTNWLAEIRGWLGLALLVFLFQSLVAKPFYIPSESMMPGLLVGDRLAVSKYPFGWSWVSPALHILPAFKGRLFGHLPEHGDVVILTPPDADRHDEDLIKRVIGLPGDVVQLKGGRLWLNGRPVRTQNLGYRLMPIDGNFHCDVKDPDPDRAFPGFAGARVMGKDGKLYCRLHILRETLPNGRSWDTIDFGRSDEDEFPAYVVAAGHVFVMGDNRDDSADSRVPVAYRGLGGAVPFENIGGRAEFVTFSLNGNASWNPLTWFSAFRAHRVGASLRPVKS
jgi:signal peptidase I